MNFGRFREKVTLVKFLAKMNLQKLILAKTLTNRQSHVQS